MGVDASGFYYCWCGAWVVCTRGHDDLCDGGDGWMVVGCSCSTLGRVWRLDGGSRKRGNRAARTVGGGVLLVAGGGQSHGLNGGRRTPGCGARAGGVTTGSFVTPVGGDGAGVGGDTFSSECGVVKGADCAADGAASVRMSV